MAASKQPEPLSLCFPLHFFQSCHFRMMHAPSSHEQEKKGCTLLQSSAFLKVGGGLLGGREAEERPRPQRSMTVCETKKEENDFGKHYARVPRPNLALVVVN